MRSSEDQLFAEFQRSGSPRALGAVYDRVATELLHVALHLAGNPADAEDLLQSTLLAAIEKRAAYDPARRLMPWLMGILTREAKGARARRERRPDPERMTSGAASAPVVDAQGRELDEELDSALAKLPPAFRPVLSLRLRHGLSASEIARVLDRPAGTVRSQLARGMQTLRRALPSGLAGAVALTAGRSARGLDAVRAAILAQVPPAPATLSLATLGGATLMNKTLALALGAVIVSSAALIALRVARPAPSVPLEAERGGEERAQLAAFPVSVAPANAAHETRRPIEPVANEDPPATGPDATRVDERDRTGSLVVVARTARKDPAEGAGVVLEARGADREPPEHFRIADADGLAVFADLPPGPYSAQLLRGQELQVSVRAGEVTRVTLDVADGITVVGEVVDAAGLAVPDAELWLSRRYRESEGYVIARADDAGRFELAALTEENALGARAPGFAPSSLRKVRGRPGDRVAVRLVLDRAGAEIVGSVVDPSGAPVAGARITLGRAPRDVPDRRPDGMLSPGPPPVRCTTDRDGNFHSPFVALAEQPIAVDARGFARYDGFVRVERESAVPARVVLAPESVVFGRVLGPGDEPVPFARVAARAGERELTSCLAGGDGVFRLPSLPAGVTSLVAEHAEWGRVTTELELGPGEERLWDPVISRSPRIFGRLTSAASEPLGEWTVAIRPESAKAGFGWIHCQTRPDGTFGFVGLEETSYLVYVNAPRGGWREFPRVIHGTVRPSHEPLALVLPGLDTRARIVGSVRDPVGAPASALVTVWHHEARLWREYATDPRTGAFEIAWVPPGTCTLEVRSEEHPWMRLGDVGVAAGDLLDLGALVFEPSGTLTGTLEASPDAPLDPLVFVLVDSKGAENGVVTRTGRAFESGPLAPGRYELLVRGDFVASVSRPFEIRAGARTELSLELATCGLRPVRFELPEGAPEPAWLMCWILDADGRQPWMSANVRGADGELVARISAPAGTYRLGARADNGWHAEAPFVVHREAGEDSSLTLELAPPAEAPR